MNGEQSQLFYISIIFALVSLIFPVFPLYAEEDDDKDSRVFMLDEVVVTAGRYREKIRNIPANVTVITASDIEKSTANNIVDLLSAEGGLVVRGFLGNDKKSGVDIRGMGETSVSSVLVLVDGIRINPGDMAGPDFSTISLDQVERIEIIRGASSVLYGDGAVGGVINIITRPAGGKLGGLVRLEGGSYGYEKATGIARGSFDNFHFSVIGNYSDTDGYREKGNFQNKNLSSKLAYDLGEYLSFSAEMRLHKDHYGFPGPLTKKQFREDPRQSTDPTDSQGETWEETYGVGLDGYFGAFGDFSARFTYGDRENNWLMLLTPGEIHERSRNLNLKHKWDIKVGRHLSELTVGFDYRDTDYYQETSFATKPMEVDHKGYYFLEKLTLFDKWIFQGGIRHHDYENNITTSGTKTSWTLNDYTAGLVYLFDFFDFGTALEGSLFANFATSFRIPDIDELGFATSDIRPQDGKHWDAGVKLLFGNRAEINVTYFYIRIEDEIWFDALNYINTNYEYPTKRKGVETAFRFYPIDSLKLWGNCTYMDASFEGADYKVPMVPEHKFSAGMNWDIFKWFELGITYVYVGSRPQGGDPIAGSMYEDMPSYEVVDMKLTFNLEKYHLKTFVKVNNIFDESYYTSSYYDNVYPSPERNYRVGLEWNF